MRATILGLCVLVIHQPLFAQESTDSLPFRRGQWAAEFGGGFSLASLGVLKFRSPTSAWLLNFNVSAGHNEVVATGPINDVQVNSHASITVRAGRRSFKTLGSARILAFHSFGVLAGFSHQAGSSSFLGSGETNGWSTGFFGELGGRYLVTPHIGVGVTGGATARYSRSVTKPNSGVKSRQWSFDLDGPVLSFAAMIAF